MNQIYLLTGPIHSGKTSKITEWLNSRSNVDGIIQPLIDGKRHLKLFLTNEIRPLETTSLKKRNDLIKIGNYIFSNETFEWAREGLLAAFYSNPEWLIIDEYGKLELVDKGLEPAIGKIMNELNEHPDIKIVLIIRDYLVNSFLNKYNLNISDIKLLDI